MRATVHFICMTAAFSVILLYGSGNFKSNSSGSMMLLIVFIVLYLLIAPFPIYLIYSKEQKSNKNVEYKSIYKN
jgi:hypothetical protein